jgi:hypothetical protein
MENGTINSTQNIDPTILDDLGYDKSSEFHLEREDRIELAMRCVREGAEIARVVGVLTWKDFEGFVAGVLSENGFICTESYRRRGNEYVHGMEIDVIGHRGRNILSVDAKLWGVRAGKASALRTAARKQRERSADLAENLDKLSKKLGSLRAGEYSVYPVMVTWLVEDIEIYDGIPVVPIFKLNSFVLSFEQYQDMIVSSTGYI